MNLAEIPDFEISDRNDLARALSPGVEFWKLEHSARDIRNFHFSLRGKLAAKNAVRGMFGSFRPKVEIVDGHKSRLFLPEQQGRNSVVFDQRFWAKRLNGCDLALIPLLDGFDDFVIVQLFIEHDQA